ncbi:unnamed protein product, partial [Medioppia subpectinata]
MSGSTNTTGWATNTTSSSPDSHRRTSGGHPNGPSGVANTGGVVGGAKFPGRVIMKNNYFANNSVTNNSSMSGSGSSGDRQRHGAAKQRTSSLSAMNTTPTKTSGGAVRVATGGAAYHHHKRNNSSSFEVFTASCDDAWDSTIDDCLQTPNHFNNYTSNHPVLSSSSATIDAQLSNHISGLLIREMPSTSKPLKPVSKTNTDKNKTNAMESAKIDTNIFQVTETDPKLAKITRIV